MLKISSVAADLDHDGFINDYELTEVLKETGLPQPGYKIRDMIKKLDRDDDSKISFNEFLAVSRVMLLTPQWKDPLEWHCENPR